MIDQEREDAVVSEPAVEEDTTIGRPDWSARENATEEEDDDWMMQPPSSQIPQTALPQVSESQDDANPVKALEQDGDASSAHTDRLDPSRFDMDAGEGDQPAHQDLTQQDDSQGSVDGEQGHQDRSEFQDAEVYEETTATPSGNDASSEDVQVSDPASPASDHVRRETVDLSPEWEGRAYQTVDRWSDLSERHTGREAFKTGLVLPLLNALGYDTFDPDQVEPLEDDSGQHDGYLAKGPGGELVVLLADTEVADDHREKVSLRARRDRVTVGIRIPNEEGEGTRWQAVIEVHLEAGSAVTSLSHVHRDVFDPEEISSMARQMHGQQEHILEAMRRVILGPGNGFVEDVRHLIVRDGHGDPAMLSERVALLASKLFAGEKEDEIDQDDDKTRQVTPAEQLALDNIRRICGPEISPERIVGRPAQSYLAVLLDDNNRRTIARLHFSAASRKHIGVFTGREETRHAISGPSDVGEYTDDLRRRAKELDPDAFPDVPDDED